MTEQTDKKRCFDCNAYIYNGGECGSGLCHFCKPNYGSCQYCGYGTSCHDWTKQTKEFFHIYLGTSGPVRRIKLYLCDKHINSLDNVQSYQPIINEKSLQQ